MLPYDGYPKGTVEYFRTCIEPWLDSMRTSNDSIVRSIQDLSLDSRAGIVSFLEERGFSCNFFINDSEVLFMVIQNLFPPP